CLFAVTLTSAETFAYSASQTLLIELAGPEDLDRANARFYAIHAVCMNVVGPVAAGAVFVVSPAVAFTLDGLTFLIAAVLVAGLPALLPARDAAPRSFLLDVREGVQILATNPGLRTLVGMVSIAAATLMVPNTLMSLYAVEVLRFTPMEVAATVIMGASG